MNAIDKMSNGIDIKSTAGYTRRMISPSQIRGARAMLGLKQADLAEMAGISKTGLINIESGASDPKSSTLKAIQHALETAGVIFVAENGEGPGVRLRKIAK